MFVYLKNTEMNIEPLHEKILVKQIAAQKETLGGVLIPEESQKKPSKAVVIAVGEGLKDRPMSIRVGATVHYIFGAGTKIDDEDTGEEYLIMRDNEVLAQS